MADNSGNGELIHAIMAVLGELRAERAAREAKQAEYEQRNAEHEQRMAEWAVIISRINAQQDALDAKLAEGRKRDEELAAKFAELDVNMRKTSEKVRALSDNDKVLTESLQSLVRFIQVVGLEMEALKTRVDVLEQGHA